LARSREADLESKFQSELIDELEVIFPGCIILKNDSALRTGIPDLTIFYYDRYAILEVKAFEKAIRQPNQGWYIEKFAEWAFGAFIYPENKEEGLNALQQALQPPRSARVS
jgi:hypothetical protein